MTDRGLTTVVQDALQEANVPYLVLVELNLASGYVRVTNAAHDVTWNGATWIGVGELGAIDAIEETTEFEQNNLSLKMSGIPSNLISIALQENYQGRPVTIRLAPLDSEHQFLANPIIVFRGLIDTQNIESGKMCSITLTAQSRLSDWDRPRVRRWNHEDQIAVYPTDRGLEFVQQMVEKQIVWGRTNA
jgi:hypothetical protein